MRAEANRLWHIQAEVWEIGSKAANELVDKKILASDAAAARNWITHYASKKGMWVLKLDLKEIELPAGQPYNLAPPRLPAPSPTPKPPCTYKAEPKPDPYEMLMTIEHPGTIDIERIEGGDT